MYALELLCFCVLLRYIPEEQLEKLKESDDDLSDFDVSEIKKINYDLVHKLKSNDSAFSLGKNLVTHLYPH